MKTCPYRGYVSALFLTVALSTASPHAFADLLGDQVDGCFNVFPAGFPCDAAGNQFDPPTATVVDDPSPEFSATFPDHFVAADLSGDSLTIYISALDNLQFGFGRLWEFSGLDWVGEPEVIIDNITLIDPNGIVEYWEFGDHSISIVTGAFALTQFQVVTAVALIEASSVPGPTPTWTAAYATMLVDPADLQTFRAYRDRVLAGDKAGRLYKDLLYDNSAQALQVLEDNPDLMDWTAALIEDHKETVARAKDGEEAVIDNTAEVADFLERFAQKSPRKLKVLAYLLRWQILEHHRRSEPFLGLTWE